MSHSQPGYVLRTDLDPVIHGVALERVIVMPADRLGRIHAVCLASIPQEIWLWPKHGIEWAPGTPGATNLAACILDRWLPAEGGQIGEWEGRPVPCAPVVCELAPRFASQVVAQTPYWGGMIDRDLIARWMQAQPELCGLGWIDLGEDLESGRGRPYLGRRS